MKNTFFSQQLSQTDNLESVLITRQHEIIVMAQFLESKKNNLTLKQSEISEIAKKLGMSSSALQRYRNDINKLSP